jgi:hypothetical protein
MRHGLLNIPSNASIQMKELCDWDCFIGVPNKIKYIN